MSSAIGTSRSAGPEFGGRFNDAGTPPLAHHQLRQAAPRSCLRGGFGADVRPRWTTDAVAIAAPRCSLCVMKMMMSPPARSRLRHDPNGFERSPAASTAVGSSRMRTYRPDRARAESPAVAAGRPGSAGDSASGSTSSPYLARPARALAGSPRRVVERDPGCVGRAEHDVLRDGQTGMSMKCWCTIPVRRVTAYCARLERTDSRSPGSRPSSGCTARKGRSSACRLTGAVLAEQRVHLAPPDGEFDAVVRDDAGKRFVIPRSSRTGASSIAPILCRAPNSSRRRGRAHGPPADPPKRIQGSASTSRAGLTVPAATFFAVAIACALMPAGTPLLIVPRPSARRWPR